MKYPQSGCCLLGVMMLTGCSTMTGPEPAPESVANRSICLDDTHAQICECPIGSSDWSAWHDFRHGCALIFTFDAANQYRSGNSPGETTCMTYRKTGPSTGEIHYESAEMEHTCYLQFETPNSGSATKEGYGGEYYYKQRHIQFQLK